MILSVYIRSVWRENYCFEYTMLLYWICFYQTSTQDIFFTCWFGVARNENLLPGKYNHKPIINWLLQTTWETSIDGILQGDYNRWYPTRRRVSIYLWTEITKEFLNSKSNTGLLAFQTRNRTELHTQELK